MKQLNHKIGLTIKLVAILLPMFFFSSKTWAQTISYMLPDIGTPGMNTYVEIIGPYNISGNYGLRTGCSCIHLNAGNDDVQLKCANPDDTNKIIIGPVKVNWDGRMLFTQFFVLPWVNPNSDKWYLLKSEFRIPIVVSVNGKIGNTDTFYILKPQHFLNITAPNSIIGGKNSPWIRSRRGAIIVDSMDIRAGPTRFSTEDCDPYSDGNQGYLPVTILCMKTALLGNGNLKDTTFSVSAIGRNGGPGGGGAGGGEQCGQQGGDGYTGGGGDDLWKSGCAHNVDDGNGSGYGKTGLSGVPGGKFSDANEGGGGGTGHPFGESGSAEPPYSKIIISSHGGGTGGRQDFTPHFCGGGGGGFGTPGSDGASQSGGLAVGNKQCVPFSGGSGGGGGNTCTSEIGGSTGGGGGGGIALFAKTIINNYASISANGGDGDSSIGKEGSGGGGSGGAIYLATKLSSNLSNVYLCGGNGQIVNSQGNTGGNGGDGRLRLDGPISSKALCNPTIYRGPTTDTTSHVLHNFTITGTSGVSSIFLFLRPLHRLWRNLNVINTKDAGNGLYTWQQTITLPCTDSIFFLVAADNEQITPDTSKFTFEPDIIFSQAAANIFYVKSAPTPTTHILTKDTSICAGQPVQLNATGGAFFKWNPVTNLSDPDIADPIARPVQSTTYVVSSYNAKDCASSDSVHINIKNGDVLPLQKTPFLCLGSSLELKVNGKFDSIKWNTGEITAHITVNPQTTTSYWYRVVDKGCVLLDTILVKVVSRPKAGFDLDTIQGAGGLLVHFTNSSISAVKYVWDFGDNTPQDTDKNPVHFFTKPGKRIVRLIAFDSLGCSDTAFLKYVYISDSFTLFIPDAFSPNGDGTNDLFEIKSIGIESIYCAIYNRWGELMYESTITDPGLHPNLFWDGNFKGQKACNDVYIYIINAQSYNGYKEYRKGNFTIVR